MSAKLSTGGATVAHLTGALGQGVVYVGFLGCQTSGTWDKWNYLISWIVGQVGRQTSCMDLSIRHQIRHTKCDIKDFMKMVDEFRTKNTA